MTAIYTKVRQGLKAPANTENELYASLDQLDGTHPWQQALPESCVLYPVRVLPQGRAVYFNFSLAKEMGLIPESHPETISPRLNQKLVETFSLQILNEYDQSKGLHKNSIYLKPNKYMATRYLQLQHSNKQGRTSGDGRGIWNGVFRGKGGLWDVSSRGTGVTCLAPGSVEARKPLKTGCTDYGYGCGQAEIDELYGAAILAERMHLQGVPTERVLCIIDLGQGVGIGVRAAPNLIRPAHLFLYLKQNRWPEAQRGINFFIERQKINRVWTFDDLWPKNLPLQKLPWNKRWKVYDRVLEFLCEDFAHFTAKLETEYVFTWLDWDGDNVLANAGIIDYGSVRQFGIRHDQYRYDDVERFSTNLNEQKLKAKLMLQTFAQLFHFVKTKNKRSQRSFSKHKILGHFDMVFKECRMDLLIQKMGFDSRARSQILLKRKSGIEDFERIFTDLEKLKVSSKPVKVPDGINHPPLLNLRKGLVLMSEWSLATHKNPEDLDLIKIYESLLSSFAKPRDKKLSDVVANKLIDLLSCFQDLTDFLFPEQTEKELRKMRDRAKQYNPENRMTGNALIQVVDLLVKQAAGSLPPEQIQLSIEALIRDSVPANKTIREEKKRPLNQYIKIIQEFREDI